MINVLVVDDQKFVYQIIKNNLAQESDLAIIDFADNGQTGIDKVALLKPDVVLMDINMPVMDGFTATKIITEKFLTTKVLLLTADDNEEYLIKALEIGAKGYWLKNANGEELANAIRYVHRGYFQLGLELIEKYLHSLTESKLKSQDSFETKKPKNIHLDRASVNFNKDSINFSSINSRQLMSAISKNIENIVKKEIHLLLEQEANLQFRVDRLKHQLNLEAKNIKIIFKIQLVCILLLVILIIMIIYFRFLK